MNVDKYLLLVRNRKMLANIPSCLHKPSRYYSMSWQYQDVRKEEIFERFSTIDYNIPMLDHDGQDIDEYYQYYHTMQLNPNDQPADVFEECSMPFPHIPTLSHISSHFDY